MKSKILKKTDDFIMIKDENGIIWIEYRYSYSSKKPAIYQRTRLIVKEINGNIANCEVYWSDINNVVEFINNEWVTRLTVGEKRVALEWHYDLLLDDQYVIFLMKYLLDKKRVSKYLEGKSSEEYTYIGGVTEIDGHYRKVYNKEFNKSLLQKVLKKLR